MADPSLNNPVIIQATRLDASILPRNVFSQSYLLYVIAQGTDVGAIAGKANEAGQGAYDAQVKNDEQDVELADHEARIQQLRIDVDNHEIRITGSMPTEMSFLAVHALSLASCKVISGYFPTVRIFSLPSIL